ncbi:Kinase, NEK [Giardia lamblia P15]|uniref:Kinase, NEK n=1 Tax=Giardia intestinalis (strain P15) TaxID=658858 RepID=E1F918_GIAIA|nr:Kinase, NEK [Giardia lamblia P15]
MRPDPPEPAAEAPNVPEFTSRELHERLDGVLGKGVTGTVYSLRGYPNLAVKEIQLSGLGRISVDAIRLELATISNLSHPGILRYYQIVEDEGLIYIVTDRHDKTLERFLTEHRRRKSPVSVAVTLSIVRQVTAALAYFHGVSDAGAERPVRCDLRPANILVSGDGEHFIIADLGLYRDALWSESTFAGTAGYVAPETLLRNEASPASDVWGLGVILYELATLRRPDFLGDREPAEVFVDGWRPYLSAVADDFIKSILEKIFVLDPAERPTARELSEMLAIFDIPISELGHRYMALEGRCSSLETALNSANARIALLEEEIKAKADRIAILETVPEERSTKIASLEEALETRTAMVDVPEQELIPKSARLSALEDQCKEHLAMIKALENKFAQFGGELSEAEFSFLRLIHATRTNDTETVRLLLEERVHAGQRDEQGMTALMHAAQQGHTGPVELLVEKEKGIKDKSGWTALMHAAYNNHPEVVEILSPHEHGKRNNNNQTALMMAAERGHAEVASLLVPYEKGLKNSRDRTALMIAAEEGSFEAVRALVEHEKGLKDKQNHTALYYALKNGHLEIAKTIMPHDDPTDKDGITALMRAAIRGDAEMVELLIPIQKGQKDNNGHTAFMHALKNKHADIAALLREHEASSWTPLMHAAAAGDIEAVKMHLSDKDKKNSDGETALIIAARAGHKDIVELLDPIDEDGVTALMRAAERNDLATARALLPLQGGMNMTGRVKIAGWNIINGTALMVAALKGHTEIARLLVEKEGGMSDSNGWTALMVAAKRGHPDCVKLLLEKEGGMSDSGRWTALMRAAQEGHPDCVELLLEKEGGMSTSGGWTALMSAAQNGHTEIVGLLVEKERDINRSKLLNIAREKGNKEIIAILSES